MLCPPETGLTVPISATQHHRPLSPSTLQMFRRVLYSPLVVSSAVLGVILLVQSCLAARTLRSRIVRLGGNGTATKPVSRRAVATADAAIAAAENRMLLSAAAGQGGNSSSSSKQQMRMKANIQLAADELIEIHLTLRQYGLEDFLPRCLVGVRKLLRMVDVTESSLSSDSDAPQLEQVLKKGCKESIEERTRIGRIKSWNSCVEFVARLSAARIGKLQSASKRLAFPYDEQFCREEFFIKQSRHHTKAKPESIASISIPFASITVLFCLACVAGAWYVLRQ